jgi:hypothetical protein
MKIIPRKFTPYSTTVGVPPMRLPPKVLAFEDEHNARRFLRAMGSATAVGSCLHDTNWVC